jgi:membrane-bound inhibitor of C-type lysozyme
MWKLVPPPECDHVCSGISFTVEPGDIGKIQPSAELFMYSMWYSCEDWAVSVQRLGYGRDDVQFLVGAGGTFLFHNMWTGSGAHPALYTVGTEGCNAVSP